MIEFMLVIGLGIICLIGEWCDKRSGRYPRRWD